MLLSLVALAVLASTTSIPNSNNIHPIAVYRGPVSESFLVSTLELSLNATGESVILDYGSEVAGIPYFVVAEIDRPVQLEFRYSEELRGLENSQSDGPFPFSQGLSATFRVETFNVTSAGLLQSFFIEGGQRWQSIRQLTQGHIKLQEIGLMPSAEVADNIDTLPGYFQCSNEDYNLIWRLGARATMAACVDQRSQNATWEITNEGARIRGQKPALSAVGTSYAGYTLEFSTIIERGGSGWSIAQTPSSAGLQLLLVSDLPEQSSFVNTNTSLTPPNSLVLAYGYSFVNQTTLPSQYLGSFEVPFTVQENRWYRLRTALTNGTNLTVSIDEQKVMDVSLSNYGLSLASPFDPTAPAGSGSWGFGPWQDQVALVKDVVVTASNGSVLYENGLTSLDVLSEYGVAQNNATVCLDGPKRDRLVWLGDAFHTSRIVPASTARSSQILGTLQYLVDWQNEDGLLPIAPPMGYGPVYAANIGGYLGLQDYQTLGLLAFTGYFDATGDLEFAQQLWPGFKRQAIWLLSQVNETTGLADIGGFTGPASGTATSAALVQALNEMAGVATAVDDKEFGLQCSTNASRLSDAVDALLWNEELGVYVTSLDAKSNFSVADISFAITSGIAERNNTRVSLLLTALEQLKLGPGYKDSTSALSEDPATNISPNINGFLLSALMRANASMPGKYLFDNLWTAMIANETTTTGASWEYVNAHDLSPGLGLFTSLSHPWGGAPTYVFPQWIAGIRPLQPGYREWIVMPGIDGFDLTSAEARVPTQYGLLNMTWTLVTEDQMNIFVQAPQSTNGSFNLPFGRRLSTWNVNSEQGEGGDSIQLGPGQWNITVRFT